MAPNQPKTPNRAIRVPDELWKAAQAKAAERGENISTVIRRALLLYAHEKLDLNTRSVFINGMYVGEDPSDPDTI
jgi:hypothetical protein